MRVSPECASANAAMHSSCVRAVMRWLKITGALACTKCCGQARSACAAGAPTPRTAQRQGPGQAGTPALEQWCLEVHSTTIQASLPKARSEKATKWRRPSQLALLPCGPHSFDSQRPARPTCYHARVLMTGVLPPPIRSNRRPQSGAHRIGPYWPICFPQKYCRPPVPVLWNPTVRADGPEYDTLPAQGLSGGQ